MMSSSPNGLLHLVKTNQNMNLVDYMKQRKFEVKVGVLSFLIEVGLVIQNCVFILIFLV